MKSFKEFIFENDVSPVVSKHNGDRYGNFNDYEQEFTHGPHTIKVLYSAKGDGKDRYDVDFQRNGGWGRGKNRSADDKKSGAEILHKIHRHIQEFVRTKKPQSLTMQGNTRKKNIVYGMFAKSFARRHSAQYIAPHHDENPHEIVFR